MQVCCSRGKEPAKARPAGPAPITRASTGFEREVIGVAIFDKCGDSFVLMICWKSVRVCCMR
jgi:hypothetical protein